MAAKGSKSKKRSATSSDSKPPEKAVFFLDKCLGRKVVASALRQVGLHVEVLTVHFAPDTPDAEWLPVVGKRHWVILTKDRQIRNNQIEIVKLMESGAPCFSLTSADMTGSEMARAFVAALADMRRFLVKFSPPYVATITPSGRVSMLLTHSQLIKKLR